MHQSVTVPAYWARHVEGGAAYRVVVAKGVVASYYKHYWLPSVAYVEDQYREGQWNSLRLP